MPPLPPESGAMTALLTPGTYVVHPGQPDWGLGQVQSAVGTRVTVNFPHAGKRMIDAGVVPLRVVEPEEWTP
ncbi:DUF3553 domain-containing protein [Nitrospirillum sp. BR 11163]|uniref:DUF3553 domain-containing protein n=1 Tax=Nitrospirillum sp. BR 11163 TaxID=3104323 RepID=UPI002B001439|nr:DUF3553 domain-containing protein [Nitrospirillum sp. BR 11163]MEA1675826.1 DUF3553 domain-containing protein [Nitrospirillum sp. BR 11163]